MLVYLYCTVGQNVIYTEVRRCLEKGGGALPSAGFPVTNCHSGERLLLPARAAANLLVVLAADLCEQDSYFEMDLAFGCLRLAAPHLASPPPLHARLEKSGFYAMDTAAQRAAQGEAKRALQRTEAWELATPRSAGEIARTSRLLDETHAASAATAHRQLLAAASCHSWCYELQACVLALDVAENAQRPDDQREQEALDARVTECRAACSDWGTRWSRPADAAEAAAWVGGMLQNHIFMPS